VKQDEVVKEVGYKPILLMEKICPYD